MSTIIMLIIIQHYQPVIGSHRQLGFASVLKIYHGIASSSKRGLKIVGSKCHKMLRSLQCIKQPPAPN